MSVGGASAPHTAQTVGLRPPCPTYEGKWGNNIIIVCQRYDLPSRVWVRYFDFLPQIRRVSLPQIDKSACPTYDESTWFSKTQSSRRSGHQGDGWSGGRTRTVGCVGGRADGRSGWTEVLVSPRITPDCGYAENEYSTGTLSNQIMNFAWGKQIQEYV